MADFEEVYRRYFADVYKYVLALSRDEAVAEEVTQETFFKALTAIDGFRGQCQLRVWLCQIARNQYLTLCRERKRFAEQDAEPGDGGIEEGFADRDAARRLHRLLHQLPERIGDNATFDHGKRLSTGMDLVFVNGKLAWKDEARICRAGTCLN